LLGNYELFKNLDQMKYVGQFGNSDLYKERDWISVTETGFYSN